MDQGKDRKAEGVGDGIREAVAAGRDVQEAVRALTIKALRERELDAAGMRKVVHDALHSVREAAETHGPAVGPSVKEAIEGVDQALAQAAQAMKLSIEEAMDRVEQFSREDLVRARRDLADTERLFLDTLRDAAKASRGAASGMLEDLARHARATGTAVGRELERASPLAGRAAEAGRAQFEAAVHAAAASGAVFARAASGVLAGIADALASRGNEAKRPKP